MFRNWICRKDKPNNPLVGSPHTHTAFKPGQGNSHKQRSLSTDLPSRTRTSSDEDTSDDELNYKTDSNSDDDIEKTLEKEANESDTLNIRGSLALRQSVQIPRTGDYYYGTFSDSSSPSHSSSSHSSSEDLEGLGACSDCEENSSDIDAQLEEFLTNPGAGRNPIDLGNEDNYSQEQLPNNITLKHSNSCCPKIAICASFAGLIIFCLLVVAWYFDIHTMLIQLAKDRLV